MRKLIAHCLLASSLLLGYQGQAYAAPDVFSVKRGHAVIKLANQPHRELNLFATGTPDDIGYIARDSDGFETTGVLAGVTGNLTVRTKNGTSHVVIDGLDIKGNLTVVSLANDDQLDVYNSSVGGNLRVVSGPGNDIVNIENVSVQRDATLLGQNGSDTHTLFSMQINGRLNVVSGTGDDAITMSSGLAGSFTIAGKTLVNTGNGADNVTLSDVQIDKGLRTLTGGGDDNVLISTSDLLESALINTGAGDDRLTVSESFFTLRKPVFLGTAGNDTYTDGGDNLFMSGDPRIVSFDIVEDAQ